MASSRSSKTTMKHKKLHKVLFWKTLTESPSTKNIENLVSTCLKTQYLMSWQTKEPFLSHDLSRRQGKVLMSALQRENSSNLAT